jgi:hypothetical protein
MKANILELNSHLKKKFKLNPPSKLDAFYFKHKSSIRTILKTLMGVAFVSSSIWLCTRNMMAKPTISDFTSIYFKLFITSLFPFIIAGSFKHKIELKQSNHIMNKEKEIHLWFEKNKSDKLCYQLSLILILNKSFDSFKTEQLIDLFDGIKKQDCKIISVAELIDIFFDESLISNDDKLQHFLSTNEDLIEQSLEVLEKKCKEKIAKALKEKIDTQSLNEMLNLTQEKTLKLSL